MKKASRLNETTRDEHAHLAALASTGCRSSFEKLARHYHPKLVAHAYRLLGHRDQAQDATQSAWLEIAKGISQLRDARAFPAWAFRIATRRCAHQISTLQADRALAASLEAELDQVAVSSPSGSSDFRGLIAALPAGQRAAVALVYHEGMSVAEAAVALDIPAGTVKTRLMHARRKLATLLEGENNAQ